MYTQGRRACYGSLWPAPYLKPKEIFSTPAFQPSPTSKQQGNCGASALAPPALHPALPPQLRSTPIPEGSAPCLRAKPSCLRAAAAACLRARASGCHQTLPAAEIPLERAAAAPQNLRSSAPQAHPSLIPSRQSTLLPPIPSCSSSRLAKSIHRRSSNPFLLELPPSQIHPQALLQPNAPIPSSPTQLLSLPQPKSIPSLLRPQSSHC